MAGEAVTKAGDPARALVKAIAMDIGKEVATYIEVMYPDAVKAASSTFLLSVRNSIYNEIMAALDVTEEGKIIARINRRKKWRREWKALWKKIRYQRTAPNSAIAALDRIRSEK